MSKNTGTSELINYFDLGANGDVGIAGSLDINTIANATTDTDTFLVSDTGIIKYRTGAQLLSDIGAAPAVAGGYVPYSGAAANVDLGVYSLTASAIIANGSGSNAGIVHLESNAFHSLVNGYGSIASGTTNQFNLYQTTAAGVFRGAILSLNSITASAIRTFTLPDSDGTIALTSQIPANAVGGTGTTNYLPKFTGASTIGNSNLINDASGNLGLGVTPSAWISVYRAFNIGLSGLIYSRTDTDDIAIGLNWYRNSGGSFLYNSNGYATIYAQNAGVHYWYNAPSGTAGNAISFTQAMTLTSGGNLLIGTTTDNGARLQVSGTATFSGNVGLGTLTPFSVTNFTTLTINGTNASLIEMQAGGTSYARIQATSSEMSLLARGGTPMVFYTNPGSDTERMRITSGGNLLVGTTTDNGARLQVSGAATVSGNVGVNGSPANSFPLEAYINSSTAYTTSSRGNVFRVYNSNTGANIFAGIELGGAGTANDGLAGINGVVTGSGSGALTFYTRDSNTFSEKMRITSSGNVGIGTASPAQKLEVNGRVRVTTNGSNGGDMAVDAGGLAFSAIGATPITFQRSDFSAESMRITSGGNVLIGTTTDAGQRLQVSGTGLISGETTIGNAPSGTNVNFNINGVTNKAGRIRFMESGSVMWVVGNGAASENGRFEIFDNVNGTGVQLLRNATSWTSLSDERFKNIIEPIKVNDKLKNIRAVVGKYKTDNEGVRRNFLIAQDLLKVFPEVVDIDNNKEKPMGVRYQDLIPILVSAIQELKQEIDTLKK